MNRAESVALRSPLRAGRLLLCASLAAALAALTAGCGSGADDAASTGPGTTNEPTDASPRHDATATDAATALDGGGGAGVDGSKADATPPATTADAAPTDAHASSDSSTIETEAGAATDSGTEPADAGPRDSGSTDTGAAKDSGASTADAASGADGGFAIAAHPAYPQIPENGGPVLKPMKLVSIVATGDPLLTQLNQFTDTLPISQWWSTVVADYGLGTARTPVVHVTGAAMTADPDQTAMETYIQTSIAGNAAAAADANTMYILFLPPNVVAFDDPTNMANTGCSLYGGFHTAFGSTRLRDGGETGTPWGFAQRCDTRGNLTNDLSTMTVTASHEILETATDPLPDTGWVVPMATPQTQPWKASPWALIDGEVADLCSFTNWTEGSFTYQRIWSNTAARGQGDPCVPRYNLPYVNASVPNDWYTVTAGQTVTIPVTGFSDAASTAWNIQAEVFESSVDGFKTALTSATNNRNGPTVNNGTSATLTVTAPSAASGSWAFILVESQPVANTDDVHIWPVGVYIP